MDNYSFHVAWSEDDSAYVALCPEFPGLSALAEAPEDALNELKVAIGLALDTIAESGDSPPTPQAITEFSGQFRLRLPRTLHQTLTTRAKADGVSLNTLAVTYLAQAVGTAQTEGRAARQYREVLAAWSSTLNQLQVRMVEFGQPVAASTDNTVAQPEYQDRLLQRLYDQSEDTTHRVEILGINYA